MIHFFCALHCEAEPLIQRFKLNELKQFELFRLFQSEDESITLTITGIGKLNAASAVSYHHACINTFPSDIWINMGIAGHKDIDIGEIRLINKISDEHEKNHWYPQILFESPCPCISLLTLDSPSTDYQTHLIDMEASAFYQMASRLGTSELIHCIKIISDNLQQPAHTVNANNVKSMIAVKLDKIENILNLLKPVSEELKSMTLLPREYTRFIEQWHFTESQRIKLQKLLRQWSLRLPEKDSFTLSRNLKTGKEILVFLQNELNNTAFSIYD